MPGGHLRLSDQASGPRKSATAMGLPHQGCFPNKTGPGGARVATGHYDKMTRAGSYQHATYQSRPGPPAACSPPLRASGVGVSVLPGGSREASVPSGSCQACRIPACSVTRSSVPGDATQRNVFWSLQLCQPSPLPAHFSLHAPPLQPRSTLQRLQEGPCRRPRLLSLPGAAGSHLLWLPPTETLRSTGLG